MTGIERLRQFAKGCRIAGQNAYSNDITAIADHIEREQGGRVSRMRVLSVVTEMERHVLGVEGMEDSPVARWARELREALGGDGRDRAADVSMSAYDLLPQEDREAIAWVREHGGLERVKDQRRESMSHAAYERKKAGFLDHIAECERALGRRRDAIARLANENDALRLERAQMRPRLMPEGMEWPRCESGELVMLGDPVPKYVGGGTIKVRSIEFREGVTYLREGFRTEGIVIVRPGERVKRPAVPAGDGEPLEVGQTVWDANGDELVIGALEDGGHTVTCRYVDVGDGIPVHGMWSPSDLTHRAPVLAADGKPLREGEHVYHVETGAELVVKELPKPGEYQAVVVFAPPASHLTSFDPDQLTHERPDSWERLEKDIGAMVAAWQSKRGFFDAQKAAAGCVGALTLGFALDSLARRAKALAERERGE